MEVTELNDVKVYNLTAGKSLPQFLEEARKKQKSLKHNADFKKRIEIMQDFEFSVASTRVQVSPDASCIAATGVYPPEVRLFDTQGLGMRCLRGLNCEVIDFQILSDDYRKMVFLMADRTVEFHAQYGFHHRLRVPKAGRSIAYDHETCNLLVGGSSNEVVRIDLEVGSFQSPIAMKELEEVNQVAVSPSLPVVSCAGDKGIVESYDLRDTSSRLRSLKVCDFTDEDDEGGQVTTCAYSPNGMHFAAGTSTGLIRVFDVRSSKPLAERDHMNGFPIRSLSFHPRSGSSATADLLVGSADSKSVKIWEATTGKLTASVESVNTINHLTFHPNSGMFFTANDTQRVGVYFVPSIGLAPAWCSFLDSMTEELEESKKKEVFDDYKFITTDELHQLGATELVGTKFLQPYMHGYFMDQRLHAKLESAMDPFKFEAFRKDRIKKKLDAKRTMRTKIKADKVGVNADLHKELQEAADIGDVRGISKKRKENAERAKRLLAERRFGALFEDPDFARVDGEAPSQQAAAGAPKKRQR
mmetsp:Transcript_24421/g.53070  ORF Transcript_24421/g.53070 Transcript_24421/m.53070 type:complete len:529 (-) Transcript_24421:62-1648(-)|eukprot:CAMPEP_0206452520 /NCGR_PEP_ID=MMETSP0324_2-20121206/19998_1 /ASSEMBLY_ACC=CAM_ASM_000836 /TAXON_ID=2866 /ORGANISM="Crypthecodinium cohnii, Strain Seligo" /LENGTH=528 /DNA_ID=CAMNT_0053922633 /DNA_START=117 /DNA_END=1703 /DNA_ORIENTATION=+